MQELLETRLWSNSSCSLFFDTIRKIAHYRSHRYFGNKQLGRLCIGFVLVLGHFKEGLMKWGNSGIGYLGNFHLGVRKFKVGIAVIN